MPNDKTLSFLDESFWRLKGALQTQGVRFIIFLFYLVLSSSLVLVFGLWDFWKTVSLIFVVIWLGVSLPDWLGKKVANRIRSTEIPGKKNFELGSYLTKEIIIAVFGVLVLWYLGQLVILAIWLTVFLLLTAIVILTFIYETDFGAIKVNTAAGRLSAIQEVTRDGVIVDNLGHRYKMAALSGNLGGVREPRETSVVYESFLQILDVLARAKGRRGSAFSIIEFANLAPLSKGAVLSEHLAKLIQSTKQQVVLFVIEEDEFDDLAAAFTSEVEMALDALTQGEVLAYLKQIFQGQSFLGSVQDDILHQGARVSNPRSYFPSRLDYQDVVTIDNDCAIGLMQVVPAKMNDLNRLQKIVLANNAQLKITVIPLAHPLDQSLIHQQASYNFWGKEQARAKKVWRQTFSAVKKAQVPINLFVTISIFGKNRLAVLHTMSEIAKSLSGLEIESLEGQRLARAFESFGFLPILPQRRLTTFWESLDPANGRTSYLERRLNEALAPTLYASGVLAPYLNEIREEGPSDDFFFQEDALAIEIGTGVLGTSTQRPFYLPFGEVLNSPLSLMVAGGMGAGKSIFLRVLLLRSKGMIPFFVINLKPGDPYWAEVVLTAGGKVLIDPSLRNKGDASEFRSEVKRELRRSFDLSLPLLYQAGQTTTPADELGLQIFLEEVMLLQTEQLRRQKQKVSCLVIDEAHALTALWDSLGERARLSAEILKNILKFSREWKMATAFIFQTLGDVVGDKRAENVLARTLLDEHLPFEKGGVKVIFSGGATEEQLKYLRYPGDLKRSWGIDNVIRFILEAPDNRIGRFCFLWKNAGPHFLLNFSLSAKELSLAPPRVIRGRKSRNLIGHE